MKKILENTLAYMTLAYLLAIIAAIVYCISQAKL